MRTIGLAVAVCLAVVGCAAPTPTPVPTSTPQPTATARPTVTPAAASEGTRDNPFSIDDPVTVTFRDESGSVEGEVTVKVLGLVTGDEASELMRRAARSLYEDPAPGHEYVLVHAQIEASDPIARELREWSGDAWGVAPAGQNPRTLDPQATLSLDEPFEFALKPGEVGSGWAVGEAPLSDSYRIVFRPKAKGGGAWFGPTEAFGEPPVIAEAEPTEAPAAAKPAAPVATEVPAAEAQAPVAPVRSSGVTLEQYNRLTDGMSYADAVAILGEPTQELSRNNLAGMVTVMYMWKGTTLGANMNAMFQDDKMVQRAQFGLK